MRRRANTILVCILFNHAKEVHPIEILLFEPVSIVQRASITAVAKVGKIASNGVRNRLVYQLMQWNAGAAVVANYSAVSRHIRTTYGLQATIIFNRWVYCCPAEGMHRVRCTNQAFH